MFHLSKNRCALEKSQKQRVLILGNHSELLARLCSAIVDLDHMAYAPLEKKASRC